MCGLVMGVLSPDCWEAVGSALGPGALALHAIVSYCGMELLIATSLGEKHARANSMPGLSGCMHSSSSHSHPCMFICAGAQGRQRQRRGSGWC